jgi:hypothetical protein
LITVKRENDVTARSTRLDGIPTACVRIAAGHDENQLESAGRT